MTEPSTSESRSLAPGIVVGFLGSVLIWVATPYNNYLLNNTSISDSYLPIAALFLMFVLVLLVNPALRWLAPGLALSGRCLALALAMMLVASAVPSHGLMSGLPYMLADAPLTVSNDRTLARGYETLQGQTLLEPDSFDDVEALCRELTSPAGSGKQIADWLPEATLAIAARGATGEALVYSDRHALASGLNAAIEDEAFLSCFETGGITLSKEGEALLARDDLTPRETRRLHRLTLEAALPGAIKSQRRRMPDSLFPAPLEYGSSPTVSEYFRTELPEGESIPWSAWLGPTLTWGALLVCVWMLMLGLSAIVYPQWRRNERLAFPLLVAYRTLSDEPEKGRYFPTICRRPSFWWAFAAVFTLHLLIGLKEYFPNSFPAVPLAYHLGRLFTEPPWRWFPWHIYNMHIFFVFLGAAYFMPSRIGLSIWFFELAYALYIMVSAAYSPPFYVQSVEDHRTGAMVAMAIGIVWLGRAQWGRALRLAFGRARSEEDRRDGAAGRMFLFGIAGTTAWLVWVGVPLLWSLFFVAFGFAISLVIARMVAETGMPFLRLHFHYKIAALKLIPIPILGPMALYFSIVMAMIFATGSRMSPAVLATHGIGLCDDGKPRSHWRVTKIFLGLLIVGFLISGAAHLTMNYHHSTTTNATETPINTWGHNRLLFGHYDMRQWMDGQINRPVYNQAGHLAFGAGLAAALQWLCLLTPRWPIHPLGLIVVWTYYADFAWLSILLGWLLKTGVLRYSGSRAYDKLKPMVIGLIMGEVFAAVFWCAIAALLASLGHDYIAIPVLPK